MESPRCIRLNPTTRERKTGRHREAQTKTVFDPEKINELMMTETFPKLMVETKPQIQEAKTSPNKIMTHLEISYVNWRKIKAK